MAPPAQQLTYPHKQFASAVRLMMIMNENIGSREGALQDYVDRFPPKTLDRIAALGSGYPQDQDKELLCAAFVELSRTLRCRHAALESARNGNFTETRALLDSWADEDAPSCEPAAVPNMQALGRHRTSANNVVQIYHEFRLDFSEESRRWEEKAAYLDANFGHISKDIIAKHNDPGWIPGPWDIIYETSEEEIRAAFTEYADGTREHGVRSSKLGGSNDNPMPKTTKGYAKTKRSVDMMDDESSVNEDAVQPSTKAHKTNVWKVVKKAKPKRPAGTKTGSTTGNGR
ncbi:hypothetical protein C1H76_1490 [Elsinoe australis]|uniref:Uncharacterized protein n=1 Tax=Elsinoe australis TaxID=40998 RepID=A0A4U7B460_9PEZI|nr:hypothetical protein C1H76_1490 [Elsinoe australis]